MLTHVRRLTIEWGDCDPAGIVFYPRYFAMFDASTAALFAYALEMKKAEMLRAYAIVGIPIVDTHARFFVPSGFGDDIAIESSVTAFRRSSFDVRHRMLKSDTLAGEVSETRVWAARDPDNTGRIKGKAIPQEVIACFSKPLSAPLQPSKNKEGG